MTTQGPGTNTGHGHVWERPDGMKARCGGTAICVECAKDHARWGKALAGAGAIPGILSKEDIPSTEYVEAPDDIRRCAELLVQLIVQEMRDRQGGSYGHKAHLLHAVLMQAQNAVFRVAERMTQSAYVDGIANYVAQALSIGPAERVQAQFDDFMRVFPDVFAKTRTAGWVAGISHDDTKGSA
jgi:hypothetical protein